MTALARITAIDRFIKGCREDGIYDDLNACCVMAGWDSLAGALTPLKGAAPTNSNITVYDRGVGAVFNGTSSTLDLNRAVSSDDKDDCHAAMYHSALGADARGVYFSHTADTTTGALVLRPLSDTAPPTLQGRFRSNEIKSLTATGGAGFTGGSRASAAVATYRWNDDSEDIESASASGTLGNYRLGRYYTTYSAGVVGFYSAGSATDLALLDARVSTLMADLRAIEETGFDRDAIAYIRAVEAADGAYLETAVKIAINNLVSGLKAESLWESMASTCLLCGPRTLAGALVPLKGDAPTAYGFVEGDHSRTDGLGDSGGTSYLDSNRANDADPQDSKHLAVYVSTAATLDSYYAGAGASLDTTLRRLSSTVTFARVNRDSAFHSYTAAGESTGVLAVNRPSSSATELRVAGVTTSDARPPTTYVSDNVGVFGYIASGSASGITNATFAFYSIGSSLDLAKLDSHITAYVTAIGAAI
jgi:hypothetical protein